MSSALAIISGLVLLYLTHPFWKWRRLSHIPGPFWTAISKFWIIREGFLGWQPTTLRDVTITYGAQDQLVRLMKLETDQFLGYLARIGPNEVVTSDPEVLRKIMSVLFAYTRGPCKPLSPMNLFLLKRVGYHAWKLEAGKDNLFCMRDEAAHINLRNRITAGVGMLF